MRQFNMECPKCGKDFAFATAEVDDLDDHISDLRAESYDEGAEDLKFSDWQADRSHVPALVDGPRPLWELAAAIQRGDLAEATHQLDRVAEILGDVATEHVQQARFSYRARKVA